MEVSLVVSKTNLAIKMGLLWLYRTHMQDLHPLMKILKTKLNNDLVLNIFIAIHVFTTIYKIHLSILII